MLFHWRKAFITIMLVIVDIKAAQPHSNISFCLLVKQDMGEKSHITDTLPTVQPHISVDAGHM